MTGTLDRPLAVTAMGALSAVGANLDQTCTSIRAGVAGFREHPFFDSLSRDPEWEPGEPLLAATCPLVDPMAEGCERLLQLAVPPLIELGRAARLRRDDLRESALLLALPVHDEAVGGWNVEEEFVDTLRTVTGLTALEVRATNRSGHTGMLELLRDAHRLLTSGERRFCFLLGVDSYLSPDRLEVWDEAWRLRSERNADGFLPGEAASALLLELPENANARGAAVRGRVTSLALGQEANAFNGEESSSGAGLCNVLAAAIPDGFAAQWVCCDLNGESYRAFEWGIATVRLHAKLEGMRALHHPAESTGDVGAATGGILINHALYAMQRPGPPATEAILWASADNGVRAAMRISGAVAH